MNYVWLFLAVVSLIVFGGVLVLCIRKVHPGKAGLSVGLWGLRVAFDYMIRLPIVQSFEEMDISVKKLEIHRKGKDGLVCKDNIRADISVAFYIRVEATEESVRKVAQMLGSERVSDMEQLRELNSPKPSRPRANRWSSTNSSPSASSSANRFRPPSAKTSTVSFCRT